MTYISLAVPHLIYMALQMPIGQVVLMIENPQVVILFFFCQTSISCKSSKQRTVARSSTKADYKALADGTAEVIWLQYLLSDLQIRSTPTIWFDNLGTTYLSSNSIFHARTKHVDVDYYFERDKVAKKEIQIHFISSHD